MFRLSRTLDHVGLFARTIEDLALLLEELAGGDERDPDSRPRARVPYRDVAGEAPPLPPMFAFVRTALWDRVDVDAKEAFAELCGHLGERVETVELSEAADEASEWHRVIMEAEMAANLDREWEGRAWLSVSLQARLGQPGAALPLAVEVCGRLRFHDDPVPLGRLVGRPGELQRLHALAEVIGQLGEGFFGVAVDTVPERGPHEREHRR